MSRNQKSRRSSAPRRRRRLLAEQLEDRRLLAVSAEVLGLENHVVFTGDTSTSADTVRFSVVDGYLQHNLGSLPGFASNRDLDSTLPGEQSLLLSEIGSLTFNDPGANALVFFDGSAAFDFGDASIELSVGQITISAGVNILTTSGSIDLNAANSISVNSSAVVRTVDGDFTATARSSSYSGTFQSTGLGSFTVEATGVGGQANVGGSVTSSTGSITVGGPMVTVSGIVQSIGVGPDAAAIQIGGSGSHQVRVTGPISTVDGPITIQNQYDPGATLPGYTLITSTIQSTGEGENAGTISIVGQGTSTLGGVRFFSSGAIESSDGNISIVGSGDGGGYGVELANGFSHIRSTGVGPNAASISIAGTGGVGSAAAYGIFIDGKSTGMISAVDGDVELRGTGGTGTSNGLSLGLRLNNVAIESAATTAGRGNITLAGQGGPGAVSNNTGVVSTGVNIATVTGDVLIEGQGGEGSGDSNRGIATTFTNVVSTGVGASAGKITLRGIGGRGTTPHGVELRVGTSISSDDGDIYVAGQGGTFDGTATSHTWRSKGVLLNGPDIAIASTGTTSSAATITIAGTGGGNTALNNGIEMNGANGTITSAYGDIVLSGVAGSGNSRGIELFNWGQISSTAIGPDAATINLDGIGSGNANGIFFSADSVNQNYAITSVDGDIELRGAAPTGAAIWAPLGSANNGSASITSTGSGAFAADIRIVGVDSSIALDVPNMFITANTGRVELAADRLIVGRMQIGPTAGPVSIRTDDFDFRFGATIQSSGDLTIVPLTPGTSIGLGGGNGQLNLSDEELAALVDGFQSITIGDATTGVIDIKTVTFQDDTTIIGTSIVDSTGTDINVGEGNVTLLGRIEPGGAQPGVLSVIGNLALGPQALGIQIDGTTPGETSGHHDQVQVVGAVTIDPEAQLELTTSNGFSPAVGQQFVVIDNVGTDPISGAFAGLPEGSVINNFLGSTLSARVSYLGLDAATGNDLVLTITEPNSLPVADVGGPYVITVGGSLTLDASDSSDPDDDPLTFAWDLAGNTEFADAAGASPTLSWESLVALGIDSPGDYQVTVKVDDGVDSDIAATTLTVLYATPSITIHWTDGTYNGSEFSATGSVLGFDNSEIGSPTFTYFVGVDTTGSQLDSAPVDAGTYTVLADFAGDSLHTSTSATATIVIDRADATLLVNGTTVTYDGNAHGAIGSATGVNGETLAGLNLGDSFTNVPGGTANWVFTDVTGNYNDAVGSVAIVINQRSITVTADDQTKVYGDADPVLTFGITSGSLVATDKFFGELAREAGEDVGSYAITQGSLSLSDNYDLSFVNAELEVSHAILTGDATTQDALNMAKQGLLQITVTNIEGFVNGENSDVFLSGAAFWITIAGTKYEFEPTNVSQLSDSSISISYKLKNSALQEDLAEALELATSGATAIEAGFAMESINYRLSDDYLTRLFSTVKK